MRNNCNEANVHRSTRKNNQIIIPFTLEGTMIISKKCSGTLTQKAEGKLLYTEKSIIIKEELRSRIMFQEFGTTFLFRLSLNVEHITNPSLLFREA